MIKRWTPEEDQILLMQVSQQGDEDHPRDWATIAEALPGRTNKDCRKRWCNQLVRGLRKGTWDPSEDKRLEAAVEEHGDQWTVIAEDVGTRSADQCAKRWHHSLNPALDQSKWNPDEDRNLLAAVKQYGRAWCRIQTEYFPDRASNNVKNRYVTLTRKRASQPREGSEQRPGSRRDEADGEFSDDNTDSPSSWSVSQNLTPVAPHSPATYCHNMNLIDTDASISWTGPSFSEELGVDPTALHCEELPLRSSAVVDPSTCFDPSLVSMKAPSDGSLADGGLLELSTDTQMVGFNDTSMFLPSAYDQPANHAIGATVPHNPGSTAFALTINDPSPETITGVMNFLAHSKTRFKLEIR